MSDDVLNDRIRGVVFGHAIGDAMGLGTEFLSKRQVRRYYPSGLHHMDQIVPDWHRQHWNPGDWTDDTDQMLCILDSLVEHGALRIVDIACRIHQWAYSGGRGIGRTVSSVVRQPDFRVDPHRAAERVWQSSGGQGAANGAVMRTSVLGVWDHESPEAVARNAAAACRVTHYDPRCVASCVAISRAIAALLHGASDRASLVDSLESEAAVVDHRARAYFARARQEGIGALELEDPEAMGYTLKTMGAGIWALLHPTGFREGILAVIHEGGDADTNAAVAGGVLGARFGYSGIPAEWVDGLSHGALLEAKVQQLLAASRR